ncbi:MAG TPA: DMT family transporter [Candidatus Dormibacteraeota bacterium]|nr:DMT family transporter [Candidatus Dormibacteraeota bacterium]
MSESQRGLLPYLAFVGLGLIWGMSFLFFKLGVQDMSPTVLVFVRSASGAAALALIMWLSRRALFGGSWRERAVHFVIMGVTNAVIPWTAIAWGEQSISSGLASILNATTPFWTALFIFFVIPAERPTALNYAGVLLGIVGVVILVIPDISEHGLSGNVFGALAVVVASMSYAVSALYQRARLRGMDVFQQSLGQLVGSSVIAFPLAAPFLPQVHLTFVSMGAVLALGALGSGVAYLLYYYTMNTLGPVRATGVTFIVPITAVFWGIVLLDESLTLPIVVGMIVILAGIVLTNMRKRPTVRQVAREEEEVA